MHSFDLASSFDINSAEAIELAAGRHLTGGEHLLPVVRTQMAIALELCELPGAVAVGWEPAGSLSSVAHFKDGVERWLDGGAFPGLGLTAIELADNGGLRSIGLAFFTGQELELSPELCADRSKGTKLALRLIHELVESGRLEDRTEFAGPQGEGLVLEPDKDGRTIRVVRA